MNALMKTNPKQKHKMSAFTSRIWWNSLFTLLDLSRSLIRSSMRNCQHQNHSTVTLLSQIELGEGRGSSVASPICQEGQSERTFPIFPLFLIFSLFFPDFWQVFFFFFFFFFSFLAVKGVTLPPWLLVVSGALEWLSSSEMKVSQNICLWAYGAVWGSWFLVFKGNTNVPLNPDATSRQISCGQLNVLDRLPHFVHVCCIDLCAETIEFNIFGLHCESHEFILTCYSPNIPSDQFSCKSFFFFFFVGQFSNCSLVGNILVQW